MRKDQSSKKSRSLSLVGDFHTAPLFIFLSAYFIYSCSLRIFLSMHAPSYHLISRPLSSLYPHLRLASYSPHKHHQSSIILPLAHLSISIMLQRVRRITIQLLQLLLLITWVLTLFVWLRGGRSLLLAFGLFVWVGGLAACVVGHCGGSFG